MRVRLDFELRAYEWGSRKCGVVWDCDAYLNNHRMSISRTITSGDEIGIMILHLRAGVLGLVVSRGCLGGDLFTRFREVRLIFHSILLDICLIGFLETFHMISTDHTKAVV